MLELPLTEGGESKIHVFASRSLGIIWGIVTARQQLLRRHDQSAVHPTDPPYLSQILDLNDDFTITMSSEKRPASGDPNGGQLVVKRQNVGSSRALTRLGGPESSALVQAPRTSGLNAPVMELSGHSGEIFAAKFDPSGNLIASGSMDRTISTRCMLP